jgi:hypothetical protein
LEYLTVCIGYAQDENGDPFRYSNINVSEFSITKLSKLLIPPAIICNGKQIELSCKTQGVNIYYKLNHGEVYSLYTDPIAIYEDTFIEAYSERSGEISEVVSQNCEYIPGHDYRQDYLTLKVLTAGSIAWQAFGTGYTKTIEYSINDGTWTSITAAATTPATFQVSANDVVRLRGSNSTYAGSKANYDGFEGGTATFDVEGNIMSLVYGDNFIGNTTLSGTYNFCSLFKKANVVSAENLILPTMALTNYCYRAMFSLAPLLEIAPALPATTLAQGCYWYMCENAPITTSPELPASTLVRECYGYMFTGCGSLEHIKCLATEGFSATQCLNGWVNNVSTSGIFVKDSSATGWPSGSNGIPTNWIVQDA